MNTNIAQDCCHEEVVLMNSGYGPGYVNNEFFWRRWMGRWSFNYFFFVKPVKHHSHLCWCSTCAAHVLDGWWLMCNWEEVIRRRRRSIIARPISKTKLSLSLRRRRRRTWVSSHYVDINLIAAASIFVILISLWNSCCCDLSWPSSAEDLIIRHSWGTGGPSTSCVYQIWSLSRSDGWSVL